MTAELAPGLGETLLGEIMEVLIELRNSRIPPGARGTAQRDDESRS